MIRLRRTLLVLVTALFGLPPFAGAQVDATSPSTSPSPPPVYQPPKPIQRPAPGYPELAKLNRVTGVLRLLLTVDESGHVATSEVLTGSGSLLLDEAALDPVIKQWTFHPATLDGRPVVGTYMQDLEYRLNPEEQRALAQRRAALPKTTGMPDPPYPEAARGRGLRGRVTVLIIWGDDGLVDRIGLRESSGSGLLDVTALRWAYEHWRVDRSEVTEGQTLRVATFDPDRPARAAALTSETPPPLGAARPAAIPSPGNR